MESLDSSLSSMSLSPGNMVERNGGLPPIPSGGTNLNAGQVVPVTAAVVPVTPAVPTAVIPATASAGTGAAGESQPPPRPRAGRSTSRHSGVRTQSGPRSGSKPKHDPAQLRLENAELRRRLDLATGQVQHLVGVAKTNESAWEHEKAAGQHAVALSQAQVSHVAGVAQRNMQAFQHEEAQAQTAIAEARAQLERAENNERIIQQQQVEMNQMRTQAFEVINASQSRQSILVQELQAAAAQESQHSEKCAQAITLYAEAKSRSQNDEQLSSSNAEHIKNLESIVSARNESFHQSQKAAELMGKQVTELRTYFQTEYSKVENEALVLRGKLAEYESAYNVSCENYNKVFQDYQESLSSIRERDEYIEALNRRLSERDAHSTNQVPVEVVQKIVDEGKSRIQTLEAQVSQLMSQVDDLNEQNVALEESNVQLKTQLSQARKTEESATVVGGGSNATSPTQYWMDYFKVGEGPPSPGKASFVSCDDVPDPKPKSSPQLQEPEPRRPAPAGGVDVTLKVPDVYKLRPKQVQAPPFPNINEQTSWLSNVAKALVASSVYDDRREVEWLMEVKTKKFEELSDSGEARFAPLDSLLAIALESKLPQDLRRKVSQASEKKLLAENDVLTGRQIVWMVLNYFKTSDHMSILYSYDALMDMKWFGDKGVEEFLFHLNRIIDNLEDGITDKAIRDVLFRKMEHSTLFAQDIAYFKREKAKAFNGQEAPDYSLEFLMSCLKRQVSDELEQKQVAARRKGLMSNKLTYGERVQWGKVLQGEKMQIEFETENYAHDTLPGAPAVPKIDVNLKRVCFFHQKALRGEGTCYLGDKCTYKHSPKLSDADYKKLSSTREAKGRSKGESSPGPKGPGAAQTSWSQAKYFVDGEGRKHPVFCHKFANGSCTDDNCKWPHLSQQEIQAETESLNS